MRTINFKFRFRLNCLIFLILLIGCVNSTTELPSPERIGQKARTRVISGNQAARVINKMHSQSVAAVANVIVEYGQEQKDILYISFYKEQKAAG